MRHLSLTVALVATLAMAFLTAQASADPAVVFNFGQGNSTCSINAFGGSYAGSASTVVSKDSNLLLTQCHAVLTSGAPVSSTQVVHSGNCVLDVAPAGEANLTCTKPKP
jgi:hypothetical protein